MTRNELKTLFNHYLRRDFSEKEWLTHGNKQYHIFEDEISKCKEYNELNLKQNIKIGILLTGHIRKNSVLNGLLNLLTNYNYDIFIHTWDNLGLKGDETNINDSLNKDLVISEIEKIPNVKDYLIENNKLYIESIKNTTNYFNFSSPEKFIKSQLYSINKTFTLLEDYSIKNDLKYDIIFKFRFDTEINEFNLPLSVVNDIIDYNIIFTPNNIGSDHSHMDNGTSCWACDNMYYSFKLKNVHIFEHTNVICDLFAYGNQESMKKYCSLYNHYDELNIEFNHQNTESLKINNKNVKLVDGDYKFIGNRGHIDSLYYFYCSYPERLLQKFLKDYMLVESKTIKLKLIR